jgi:hypothetical protein
MDVTLTFGKDESPELLAMAVLFEDPEQLADSEDLEVFIEDVEYECGSHGDRDCPPEPAGVTGGHGAAFLVLVGISRRVEIEDQSLVAKLIELRADEVLELAAEEAEEAEEAAGYWDG